VREWNCRPSQKILSPVLGEVEATSLECCEPFDRIIETAQHVRSLRDLVEQGLMEQGRLVKEAAGGNVLTIPWRWFPFAISISPFGGHSSGCCMRTSAAIESALMNWSGEASNSLTAAEASFSASEPVAKLRQFS